MTEIDFVDGDEASDETVQNYQKHSRTPFGRRPGTLASDNQGRPGRELSRSQKSRMNSNARLRAYDARQHALERVHSVIASCANCGRSADVNVDLLPETLTVPEAGKRLRCSNCGGKTISTRPAWHTSPRQGGPDYRRERPPVS